MTNISSCKQDALNKFIQIILVKQFPLHRKMFPFSLILLFPFKCLYMLQSAANENQLFAIFPALIANSWFLLAADCHRLLDEKKNKYF